jgi:NADH-quinone oxidoreductase subunit G
VCGIRFGFLGEAANSVGGYLAKALPANASSGLNADQMLAKSQRAYLLLHAELELDSGNPSQAMRAMSEADFVVALSPFRHKAVHYADVLLPIAPFSETAGSFINTEGQLQTFSAVTRPLGETRPAWKVLRVLGNLFGVAGFGYDTAEDVRADAVRSTDLSALSNDIAEMSIAPIDNAGSGGLQRIADVPIYFADPLVRRSEPLQETVDAANPVASMSGDTLQQLGLQAGDTVRIAQGGGEAMLVAARDDGIPRDCVRVPAAHVSTSTLGSMFGTVQLERVASEDEVSA